MSEDLTTSGRRPWLLRLAAFLLLLYLFLVAIELLSGSFKAAGSQTAERLFEGLANPFAGLAVGILATVLVQSSSVTTSTIVALVGSQALPMSVAVPMVMGANIGTSITNTLVSLGHVTRRDEFRRAFAGATVHDFFNLLTVAIMLPLEIATGLLQKSAAVLAGWISDWWPQDASAEFKSPIKKGVKWGATHIHHFLEETCGLEGGWLAGALFLVALVLIITSLYFITRNMRVLMADRIEHWLNRVLERRWGLVIGIGITVAVQSSSITTSLLVPMFGAGVLTLEAAFPIVVGANIGTTVTALLAALVQGPAGMTIALVHLLFNLAGTLLFVPLPAMRRLPIGCARMLADSAARNRIWVIVYISVVFFLLPLLGYLAFAGSASQP